MVDMPHWPVPLGKKPIDLGLDRVEALLLRLGNPEKKLPPVVHVAGTNGKGSTIAYLRAFYEEAGYTVHAYTSPHLVSFNERIVVAGKPIEDTMLYDVLEECRKAAEGLRITFFEGTTAAAFAAFARVSADIVLLETGMGGRLDATNVLDAPALTVITPVSMDHTEFLGDTLAKIAGEKAAIMKQGVPCVCAMQEKEAETVVEKEAEEKSAPLYRYGREWQIHEEGEKLYYSSSEREYKNLPLPVLPGRHQYHNAGMAIACTERLQALLPLSTQHIGAGLQKAFWPARLQHLSAGKYVALLPDGCELWLDGGHNPAAGDAIADMARQWQKEDNLPLCIICGMLAQKDVRHFLEPIKPYADRLIAIPIPDESQSLDPAVLCDSAKSIGYKSEVASDVEHALQQIVSGMAERMRILICGSLYLSGYVLRKNNEG